MVETSTQNEMIKAIYHELNSEDMVELEMQLENNAEFENNFEDLSVLKSELNKLIETPSDYVIQNILNYSISYIK
ncbi:MAG: hypothetical protein ACK45U_06770 [bacterium]